MQEPNRRLLQDSGDIQFLQSMLSLNQESQKLSPSIIKIHKLISINDSELHQNLEKMDLSSRKAVYSRLHGQPYGPPAFLQGIHI